MKHTTILTIFTYLAIAIAVSIYIYPRTSIYITLLALAIVEGIWTTIVLSIKDLSGLKFLLNPGAIFVMVFLTGTVYLALQGYGNRESTVFGIGAAFASLPIGFMITKYWNI